MRACCFKSYSVNSQELQELHLVWLLRVVVTRGRQLPIGVHVAIPVAFELGVRCRVSLWQPPPLEAERLTALQRICADSDTTLSTCSPAAMAAVCKLQPTGRSAALCGLQQWTAGPAIRCFAFSHCTWTDLY